ncbi:MAG: UDP-N-acetylmuramoyl-L-alanyl-D-glutamate--2,6-diaminopimelate ligase [Gemmatimonadales bacterium]
MSGIDPARLLAALAAGDLLVEVPRAFPPVSGLTADSRSVAAGHAFVAVRGSLDDGHRFAGAAVRAGAAALVVERPLGLGVPEILVRDSRRAAIALARAWYDDPARALGLVGVTGTSGKTTSTALVRHLLNGEGEAGSMGTLGAFDGRGESVVSTAGSLTTPGPIDLQATLARLLERGCRVVAMETSSHSLDQGRLDGVVFAGALFTNLSREHLDYHQTMEAYRAAKLRLLDLLAPDGVVAVNRDDPAWAAIPSGARVIGFGLGREGELRARDLLLGAGGSRFVVDGRFGAREVSLPLPGAFNVANALGAAAVTLGMGLSFDRVMERLERAPQVPGRMERLVESPFVVLRDYAHKPDALERVLQSLRPLTSGRLTVVFGCGGDRDRGKRPMMGQIAARLADLTVVTSDNPRTEDPDRILDDIVAEWPGGAPLERISDRRAAIGWALDRAEPGDTVLLAGKGNETYQIIGHEHFPFDERTIVRSHLGLAD